MRRVLVTGATGFVGSACVKALAAGEWQIIATARKLANANSGNVAWRSLDLFDANQVNGLLSEIRPTHLLHLAWETTPGTYWTSPDNFRWLSASLQLFQTFAACGGQRFVGAGTCAEYDWTCNSLLSEDCSPCNPSTLYGSCKLATWTAISAYARQLGLPAAWGRIFFVYGPGEKRGRLIPDITAALLEGRPAPCTAGTQTRDFIHVDDVAAGFAALLDADCHGAFNLGSGLAIAIREIAQLLADQLGRPDLLKLGALPSRPGDPPALVADTNKLRNATHWQPCISLTSEVARKVTHRRLAGDAGASTRATT